MGNKIYRLRFREINRDIFSAIKSGRKKIETRAASQRYKNIESGDVILLVCGKNRFEKKVRRAEIFKSVPALLKKHKVRDINPNVKSKEELTRLYNSFPGYKKKLKKFGIIALTLK